MYAGAYVHVCIYIYIDREREREIYIVLTYIYICIYEIAIYVRSIFLPKVYGCVSMFFRSVARPGSSARWRPPLSHLPLSLNSNPVKHGFEHSDQLKKRL